MNEKNISETFKNKLSIMDVVNDLYDENIKIAGIANILSCIDSDVSELKCEAIFAISRYLSNISDKLDEFIDTLTEISSSQKNT